MKITRKIIKIEPGDFEDGLLFVRINTSQPITCDLAPILDPEAPSIECRTLQLWLAQGKITEQEYGSYYRIPQTNRCTKSVSGWELMLKIEDEEDIR